MNSLPGDFTRFIGRRHELSEIRHLLSKSRLVTLTGIGGAGKTRIARRLTAELQRTYRDGTWMVELADLHDPELLGHTVSGTLGLQVQSGAFDLSLLTDFLAGRQALLTLDNCEHLSVECASLVAGLLQSCQGLKILATSLQPLGMAGEAVFQVPPLSVPDIERLPPLEAFGQYESITLFLDRATAALPSFTLTAENAESVARLVNALEGVPLALELAAARIRVLSPQAMLERIGDQYHLLSRGFSGAPARQRSLMSSVDWSFNLCTPAEQTLWSRLAVFTGWFELEAAEAICSGDGLGQLDILDLVTSLLDKSVLVRNAEEPVRYRMLETIRQYGVTKLRSSHELDMWRGRHRDWYATLVARSEAEWIGPDQVQWIERLRSEHANIRAALEHSVSDAASAPVALRMCHDLEQYWLCTGLLSEARHWSELALAHGTGTDAERALAVHICVYFASTQPDLEYAERLLRTERSLVESSGDDLARGYYLYDAGILATWRSRSDGGLPAALPLLVEGIETFRKVGHLRGQVNTMFLTGLCLSFAREFERAAELHRECLALLEPRGELFTRSYSLWALGLDALKAQDLGEATTLEREALRMKWAVKDYLGIAFVLEALGWIAAAREPGERGATLLGAAEAIWQVNGTAMSRLAYIAAQRRAGEALVRSALSEQAFERAFHDGVKMTTADAISFALGESVKVAASGAQEKSPLTRREEEVAELIGDGLSNREIAGRLVISQRTAQGHVENILRKLGFSSRTQVAAWVAERKASAPERRHLRVVGDD